jgi:acetyl esterase/lipase
MKTLARMLSVGSAVLSALTLVRVRTPWQMVLVFLPKLVAGACSPFLALAGGVGALLGLVRKDPAAAIGGVVGAVLAARHVARVTAPHDAFAQTWGPDWPSRIPPTLHARMVPTRYRFLPPAPPQVPWERDVRIGMHHETGDPLLVDVWQPPSTVSPTGLALIHLHGSGWHLQDKDFATRPFFRRLAGQGHLVVDVAYTLAPRARLHGMLADVKRAIAWTKTHAADYGADPDRVVLVGGSAGGHLALLAAYTPNHPECDPGDLEADTSVRAVVSYYGVVDLEAVHDDLNRLYGGLLFDRNPLTRQVVAGLEPLLRRIRVLSPGAVLVSPAQMVPGLLGAEPEEVPALCQLGSPIHHVGPHCPPTLLLHGSHDLGILPEHVRRLHRALLEAGCTSVYIEFPETEHGFDLICPRWSPSVQAATYDLERFLALMV